MKPTASVEPLSGYVMTGGGASIFEGMLLTASYPKDETTWEARGKDHGVPHSGKVAAYCIGLKVAVSRPLHTHRPTSSTTPVRNAASSLAKNSAAEPMMGRGASSTIVPSW